MATLTATTMLSGNTQILTKAFQISASADDCHLCRQNHMLLRKALKEIKRDLEFAYVGASNAAVTGNASICTDGLSRPVN